MAAAATDDLVARLKAAARSLSPAELTQLASELKERFLARCREDPAAFIEYVITHEKTGKPIKNAPFHKEWQDFFTRTRWGVIIAPIEHGKSLQISVGRILWELGNDPDMRILLIGRTEGQAKKALDFIRYHIDSNPRLKEVFPNLRKSPRREDPWSSTDATVARSYVSRDPSIQARGEGSKNILGSRLDLIVYDDGLTFENTKTKDARDAHESWWDVYIFSRIVDDYKNQVFGRIFAIGTPFDEDDHLHRLSRRPGWKLARYCCVLNPDDPEDQWRPLWSEQWPLKRILDKRAGMTLSAFARTLLCRVLDAAARRFKKAWLDHALWLGRGRRLMRSQPRENRRPLRCFTGVDIGVGKKDADAETVITTLAVDSQSRRHLVDIRAGHWTGPEILTQFAVVYEHFDSEFYVEGNAAQRFFEDFGREFSGVPVTAVNTGRDKWDDEYGVEALAVLFKNGFFVLPSGDPGDEVDQNVAALVDEAYNFNPASHTGDRLMSLWIADKAVRDWLAPNHSSTSNHADR